MDLEYGRKYKLKFYESGGHSPVLIWLKSLDNLSRYQIERRLLRVRDGNLGDHKYLGDSLYEMRCFYGPGYRIYFSIEGKEIIVLLKAGDKSSQVRDINIAKKYLLDYRSSNE